MTSNQQRLYNILPPKHTGIDAPKHYQKLTELPDEICAILLPLAANLTCGDSFQRIEASVKLKKLATLSFEEVEKAYQEHLK